MNLMSKPRRKINKMQSMIYLAMHLINNDDKLKLVLPEMLYSMDEDSFIRFVKICGGRTIRIPTLEEIALNLLAAVCAYKIIKENLSLETIFKLYDTPKSYRDYITEKLSRFLANLSDDEKNFIENL